jgi:hypothetical protein
MNSLNVGLVGYCPPTKYDEAEAARLVEEALDAVVREYPDVEEFTLVAGLTDMGVQALAYRSAKKRGWMTVGIACTKAEKYGWFDVDEYTIVPGDRWGVESETFLKECDVLVRIGGGEQSHREAKLFAERGGKVYAYELAAL